MLVCTTWKARPLAPEQSQRMMETWSKVETRTAENPAGERLFWYVAVDGSGGVTVSRVDDVDAFVAYELEVSLALGEFIEIDSKVVVDLDTAMPAITKALEYA
jgi:hypothetical protein